MEFKSLHLRFCNVIVGFLLIVSQLSCNKSLPKEIAAFHNKLPATIDYNLHIKPILSDRCFKCHGPDQNKREGGLRLDIKESAYQKLESGNTAIIPKEIDKSELVRRILSKDHKVMMPSPESNLVLNDEERATLIKWISQGAEYKEHWSFIKPVKVDLPKVKNSTWTKNEIDNFILSKIEQKNLSVSAEADKATLLRRVSMDLTGLPPTIAEIDAFMADKSPNAYENLVDKLIKSQHYGERMAVDWLDLARYSDTHGYQDDGYRNAYPYRDWVIKSFNKNQPYNQFITEQLAGDLLKKPTREQLIATCFNRNHPQTQEGGVVDEDYRNEYVVDRVNTFGKAFLSISFECARCHDHKYDPIPQKDFYSLYAYFNSNKETGIIPYNGEASPTVTLSSKETEAKLDFIRKKIQIAEKRRDSENNIVGFKKWLQMAQKTPNAFVRPLAYQEKNKINPGFIERAKKDPKNESYQKSIIQSDNFLSKKEAGLIGHFTFDQLVINDKGKPQRLINVDSTTLKGNLEGDLDRMPQTIKGIKGNAQKLIGDNGFDFGRELDFDRQQPFTFSLWVNVIGKDEFGPLFQKSNGEFEGHRGWRVMLNPDHTLMVNMSYAWPANAIDFRTIEVLKLNTWYNLTLTYDGASKANGLKLFINGKEANKKIVADNLNKSILYGEYKSHWGDYIDAGFMIGKDFRSSVDNIAFDEFRAYNRRLSIIEVQEISEQKQLVGKLIANPNLELDDNKKLYEYYLLNFDENYQKYSKVLEMFRDEENQLITDQEEVMVMKELDIPRKTFVLARGQYDSPTKEEVTPTVPTLFKLGTSNFEKNRLGLAKWLTNEDNPITARVVVNRLWYQLFGKGIVTTVEDFGNQGALPTHLELLDWLSVDFIENGWDIKRTLKKIVMSNIYKQSSSVPEKYREMDLTNEWYTRGQSYRLSHEQIRDNILSASGLINLKIGGKSVFPYQPEGIWEALTTRNLVHYEQSHGDSLYRRGLYTFWKRSSPPPSAVTFDASEKYICITRRQKTSTPLQSLILMNDPQYMEAARVLAQRMIKEGGQLPEGKIKLAFKTLTGRNPRKQEVDILVKMYHDESNRFSRNKKEIDNLLNVGEFAIDKSLDPKELATCTMIASTLINFDETIMKR